MGQVERFVNKTNTKHDEKITTRNHLCDHNEYVNKVVRQTFSKPCKSPKYSCLNERFIHYLLCYLGVNQYRIKEKYVHRPVTRISS